MKSKNDAIDGVAVASRRAARYDSGNALAGQPERDIYYKEITEVTLVNGAVVYQCASEIDPNCEYTAATSNSVRAHIKVHSGRGRVKSLLAQVEMLERQAAEMRRKFDTRVPTGGEVKSGSNGHKSITPKELKDLYDGFGVAVDALAQIQRDLNNAVVVIKNVAIHMNKLELATPEMADKLKKYENLVEMMRGLMPS